MQWVLLPVPYRALLPPLALYDSVWFLLDILLFKEATTIIVEPDKMPQRVFDLMLCSHLNVLTIFSPDWVYAQKV